MIIQKLMNEGFSEKTLVNLTDKQLISLSSRILGEETVMISKTSPTFQKDLDTAKKAKKTIETYEELKGGQNKLDANKNNKIDKEDFKLLKKKKSEVKEEEKVCEECGELMEKCKCGKKDVNEAKKGSSSAPFDKKVKEVKEGGKIDTKNSFDINKRNGDKIKNVKFHKNGEWYQDDEKGGRKLGGKVPEGATVKKIETKESKEKWIQKAIDPSKKGSLKKALGVKKDETIPADKLKSATKKKGKIGQKARLALTLKKLKEHSETQEWVNKLVENNYHSLTTKNEIMELIKTKLNEVETMVPMPKKGKKGHNGIPEFMTYDAIKSNAPAPTTKPKPTTKPTTKPGTSPKPKTPFNPGPKENPGPSAGIKK